MAGDFLGSHPHPVFASRMRLTVVVDQHQTDSGCCGSHRPAVFCLNASARACAPVGTKELSCSQLLAYPNKGPRTRPPTRCQRRRHHAGAAQQRASFASKRLSRIFISGPKALPFPCEITVSRSTSARLARGFCATCAHQPVRLLVLFTRTRFHLCLPPPSDSARASRAHRHSSFPCCDDALLETVLRSCMTAEDDAGSDVGEQPETCGADCLLINIGVAPGAGREQSALAAACRRPDDTRGLSGPRRASGLSSRSVFASRPSV